MRCGRKLLYRWLVSHSWGLRGTGVVQMFDSLDMSFLFWGFFFYNEGLLGRLA